jgi:hypothetical protein
MLGTNRINALLQVSGKSASKPGSPTKIFKAIRNRNNLVSLLINILYYIFVFITFTTYIHINEAEETV